MEGGRAPRDVKRDRDVVTADWGGLRADVGVDATAGGLIQTRHRRHIRSHIRGGLTSGLAQGGGMHSWRHDLHPYTNVPVDDAPLYLLMSTYNVFRRDSGLASPSLNTRPPPRTRRTTEADDSASST